MNISAHNDKNVIVLSKEESFLMFKIFYTIYHSQTGSLEDYVGGAFAGKICSKLQDNMVKPESDKWGDVGVYGISLAGESGDNPEFLYFTKNSGLHYIYSHILDENPDIAEKAMANGLLGNDEEKPEEDDEDEDEEEEESDDSY